eukprot:NODE_8734_length_540_cov_2.094431_g8711_i0.p1 GENE.NODE_8734_length_540_cov_2.094431_g8711_i0~~NODE_8734_length_540_cov_2.094431_g8711_i0.p1  ORF type:complete len:130 (+),score=5.49 NODE_8734_length_540_cov_2.094431_g8711_i0:37-390(+)
MGHRDIHRDDIGLQSSGGFNGFKSVFGFPDNFDFRMILAKGNQSHSHKNGVITDKQAYRALTASFLGSKFCYCRCHFIHSSPDGIRSTDPTDLAAHRYPALPSLSPQYCSKNLQPSP